MFDLVDSDGTVLKFLFPTILFRLSGEPHNAQVEEHQLYYTQLLEKYVCSETMENHELSLIQIRTMSEFIAEISE